MPRPLALFLVLTTGCGAAIGTAAQAVEEPTPATAAAPAPAGATTAPPAAAAPAAATTATTAPQAGPLAPVVGDPAPPLPATTATPSATPSTAAVTSTREIVLELGRRTISLRDNGKVLGSWPVAIGDPSTPTPKGRFKVEVKVVDPQYQSTKSGKINPTKGPSGPLGDRWIGFKHSGPNQYGIHGTPSAWAWTVTSRSAVTNGCVRMLTPHVRALFDQVEVGTPVVVKP
jgi:lipoprotein-anchoring transpeptidase ErfK/SrfK